MKNCADSMNILYSMLDGLDQLVDNLKDEIDDQLSRLVPLD